MCGFVAVFRRDGAPVAAAGLVAMRDSLVHRGPDDAGLFIAGAVGLGHRRLEIIDPAGGRQPMANARGSAHLVFNGEIYNYRELRALLAARGIRCRTQSDTETILGLYDLYGENCVEHLRGMFAFVLWDSARRRLLAARDRFGIKPLYMLRQRSTVAFASEIKALLLLQGHDPQLAAETLPEYLIYRNLSGNRTMVRDVERVAPGEVWVFTAAAAARRTYWRIPEPAARTDSRRPAGTWADELEALLRSAVREHLVSDVPLGTFSSGGVDSSLITAMAVESSGQRLNTYSVGFDEPKLDERPYANVVAARYGTNHHTLVLDGQQYTDWLPRAIWHHDEPLDHPHSVHLAFLSRLAREKVTVALTGEGADEIFAGYPRYRLAYLLDRAGMLPLAPKALRLAAALTGPRARARMRAVTDGGFHVQRLAAFVEPECVGRLLRPAFGAAGGTPRRRAGHCYSSLLSAALAFDQQTYLQSLLNRLDKMTMAASLEGRVPFLDHRLVEFAARVPPQLKIRGLQTKYLLKRVARRYLPDSIVNRNKAGFAVPLRAWLGQHGPLAVYVDCLFDPDARSREYVDAAALRRVVEEHRTGAHDHSELLWGLINLELWQRLVLEAARPHSAARQQEQVSRAVAGT